MQKGKARIIVAAETNSPNLGDQLIFACLRYLLQQVKPGLQVEPLDLSYHHLLNLVSDESTHVPLYKRLARFSEQNLGWPYALLNAMLQWLRDLRHGTQRRTFLEGADQLLIAGGPLFMDNHLGFPVKLYDLTRLLRRMQIPYHIVACGVGSPWSPMARHLFARVIHSAESICLRDQLSIERLQAELALEAVLCPDPALWAGQCFPRSAAFPAHTLAGICPMNVHDFNYWLPPSERVKSDDYLQWWCAVLRVFAQQDIPWRVFSNGVPQDTHFAKALLRAANFPEKEYMAPPAANPQDFCQQIQTFSHVLGTRMHPMIAAHAFGIPTLGIVWDQKQVSYFEMVQQRSALVHLWDTPAAAIPDMLLVAQAPLPAVLEQLRLATMARVQSLFPEYTQAVITG